MADQVITAQKLIDADKDATSLDAFINGTDSATVTTRKLRTYPSLAKAVKQVIETGGFEPFATETALLASVPTVTKKAAKALDTKKIWYWDGSSWVDTGLSELDQAKDAALTFKGDVLNNTDIKTITKIGLYALLTSSSYIGLPTDAVGIGCQLEVTDAVSGSAGYVLQKITSHAQSNKSWTRRVQKQPIPENNVEGAWFYSLDAINPQIISDLHAYSELQANDALLKTMHSVTTALDTNTKLADKKQVGIYTLLSTNTYPDLPSDFPVGQGAIMEVIEVTDAIRLQRITQHSQGNKVWARRVTYGNDATINTSGEWFYSLDAIDVTSTPKVERTTTSGEIWSDNNTLKFREEWGGLYTQVTTDIVGDLTKLYAFYDALVAEFPHYVTRETIGVDEWNLPIHQYVFSPPTRHMYEYPASVGKRPKVLITSGTHGSERGAQMGVIIFLDNLCRHWKDLDIYNELRWNVDIVVIPATIPSSVEDATRKNRNGVDCNRNFDWNWGQGSNPSSDPNSPMYQGPSAASEIDVQVLQAQIPARHSDAILLIENHNHNNQQAFWVGSNSPNAMHIGLEVADKVTSYLFKEIVPSADQSKTTQFVTRNYEGSFAGYMEAQGIPAILLETSGALSFEQNDGTVTSLRRLHELLLLNVVKSAVDKEMRNRAENWSLPPIS